MKPIDCLIAGFLSFLFTVTVVNAEAPNQPDKEFAEIEERYLSIITKYHSDTSPEAIQKLGQIVGRLSIHPKKAESQAFKLARERLLEIPGFAEHFKQKILAISAWENGESTVQTLERSGSYFMTLAELPHPETVRVLGELLQDDRDPTKGASSDCPYVPNSVYAADSLHGIGLRNPPVGGRYGSARKDLPTWRLWFEQVQHGKSFSFKGDTRTYTLAEKSKPATRPERRPRPKEGDTSSEPKKWADGPELLVILGLLLLGVTVAASKFLHRSPRP